MRAAKTRLPPGFARFTSGVATVVALEELVPALREALREGSLYEYAADHAAVRTLRGRGVAYAVPLPDGGPDVVVRRSRHGGMLARFTGERFVAPTRAPQELETALRLARGGVQTPELVAYATYAAGPLLRRADVLTRFVAGGRDLAEALRDPPGPDTRRAIRDAVARLLRALSDAGARHPDLNDKNILLVEDGGGAFDALVLDVDRVWFDQGSPARVAAANLRRLERSVRKERRDHGLALSDEELEELAVLLPGLAARTAGERR